MGGEIRKLMGDGGGAEEKWRVVVGTKIKREVMGFLESDLRKVAISELKGKRWARDRILAHGWREFEIL